MGNSERTKNALGTTSSISIIGWIPGRISPTCCGTRSRCTSSTTILTTRLKSQAFAPLFLVGHSALPSGSSKPTSFPDKLAKKIYSQPCAACAVRFEFVINLKTAKTLSIKIHPQLATISPV
jgi:hypothetical protein